MSTDHIVAHDGSKRPFGFECLHCGALLGLALPVAADEFAAAGEAFSQKHRDCRPPVASFAPRRCAKCGLAENEHDARHAFVPPGGRR